MRVDRDKKKLANFLTKNKVLARKSEVRAEVVKEHEVAQGCAVSEVEQRARAEFGLGPSASFEVKCRDGFIVARPADSGQKYRRIGSVEDLATKVRACAREKEK